MWGGVWDNWGVLYEVIFDVVIFVVGEEDIVLIVLMLCSLRIWFCEISVYMELIILLFNENSMCDRILVWYGFMIWEWLL